MKEQQPGEEEEEHAEATGKVASEAAHTAAETAEDESEKAEVMELLDANRADAESQAVMKEQQQELGLLMHRLTVARKALQLSRKITDENRRKVDGLEKEN